MTAVTNTDNESGVTTMSCMINEDSKCELSNKNCNEEMNRLHQLKIKSWSKLLNCRTKS